MVTSKVGVTAVVVRVNPVDRYESTVPTAVCHVNIRFHLQRYLYNHGKEKVIVSSSIQLTLYSAPFFGVLLRFRQQTSDPEEPLPLPSVTLH